jgi:hypothetical protein
VTKRSALDVLTDAVAAYAAAEGLSLDPLALAKAAANSLAFWGYTIEPSNRVTVDADWLAGLDRAMVCVETLHEIVSARDVGTTVGERARAFDELATALRIPQPRKQR